MKDQTELFLAHVKQGKDHKWEIHGLGEHLRYVADLARQSAAKFGADDWGGVAGVWHDLGKYSAEFQSYIKTASGYEPAEAHIETAKGRVNHSSAGAILAVEQFGIHGRILAYLIAGHHAGLPDWHKIEADTGGALQERLTEKRLLDRIRDHRTGQFRARVEGPVNGNILLRQSQFQKASEDVFSVMLSKAFIAGKLRNSRQILLRAARESKQEAEKEKLVQAARLLDGNIRKLEFAEDNDTVRGFEGDGARIYFQHLNLVVRDSLREDFVFETRDRRPPQDRFNALLSFLYALLLADCRSALHTVG